MAGRGVERQPFVITAVDDAVMRAAYHFPFLTPEQLLKLRYSAGSLTYARDRLRRLFEAGYLQRCHAPSHTPRGKAPFAYRLSRKGVLYCQQLGLETATIPHRAKEEDISYPALCHASAINEVLIAARLLAEQENGIRLEELQHEQQIKRKGQTVKTGKKENQLGRDELQYVLPDAWLDFRIPFSDDETRRFPLWLEIDRNTEGVKVFKRKIRGILAYYRGGQYKQAFGTKYITVVIAVDATAFGEETDAQRRVRDVTRWVDEELMSGKQTEDRELFAIGLLPLPPELDPKVFFLAPRWSQPGSDLPISLLDLPEPIRLDPPGGTSKALGGKHPVRNAVI